MTTDLHPYRDELRRRIDADEEAAAGYEAKAAELRRDAELARAELRGLERALDSYRLVPRAARAAFPLQSSYGDGED